jgi:hypothetical protein
VYNPAIDDLEAQLDAIEEARSSVASIEITCAVRNCNIGGIEIAKDDYIGILDGELVASCRGAQSAFMKTLLLVDDISDREILTVFTGKGVTSTSTVTVTVDGESRTRAETGVGPVDAALKAIAEAVNDSITLEEFKLAAVTGGSDSICEVTVMIKDVQNDGNTAVGKAVGLDVVQTSVDAMMSAINRDYARKKGSE